MLRKVVWLTVLFTLSITLSSCNKVEYNVFFYDLETGEKSFVEAIDVIDDNYVPSAFFEKNKENVVQGVIIVEGKNRIGIKPYTYVNYDGYVGDVMNQNEAANIIQDYYNSEYSNFDRSFIWYDKAGNDKVTYDSGSKNRILVSVGEYLTGNFNLGYGGYEIEAYDIYGNCIGTMIVENLNMIVAYDGTESFEDGTRILQDMIFVEFNVQISDENFINLIPMDFVGGLMFEPEIDLDDEYAYKFYFTNIEIKCTKFLLDDESS